MALALEQLPPGFRFHPTDEEIIIHYLLNKVIHTGFDPLAIGEVDLNNYEPWNLPQKAKMGEYEWFFFYKKDRKYATGVRTNRATKSGYWKSTGKDREIYNNSNKKWLLGMKKTLVFHKGRAPIGERTNWVIHEYRLHGNFSKYNTSKEEWVVCRVFQKKTGVETSSQVVELARSSVDYAYVDDHLFNYSPTSLPPLADYSFSTNSRSFETDHQEDKLKASSKLLLNNINKIQMLQHDQNSSLHAIYTSKINPNPIFHPQNFHPEPFVPYSMVATSNEGVLDQPHSRLNSEPDTYIGGDEAEMMCKMKIFSCNHSIISHSHDTTGFSNETATTDQEFEGLCFNPSSISDLDSFWS